MNRLVLCTSITVSILAGCGASAPSPAPTLTEAPPSPAGAIGGTVHYQYDGAPATTDVDASVDGATVSGTVVTTLSRGTHTVRLECAARDGDTWAFGGTVEQSTAEAGSVGGWSAVIVRDGSPQGIGLWMSDPKADGSDCGAWLAGIQLTDIEQEHFSAAESGALVPPPDAAS